MPRTIRKQNAVIVVQGKMKTNKFLISLLFFICLSSFAYAQDFNLTKNLIAYWSFDQNASSASGAILDLKGNGTTHFNLTKIGGSCWTSGLNGKINKSWRGTGAGFCYLNYNNANGIALGHVYSWCNWRNVTASGGAGSMFFLSLQGTFIMNDGTSQLYYTNEGGSVYSHCLVLATLFDGKFHNWCSTRNETSVRVFYDSNNYCNLSLPANGDFSVRELSGWDADTSYDLVGRQDETSIWKDKVLNNAEIVFLYNHSAGKSLQQYCNISSPIVLRSNLSFVFKNLSGAQKINFSGLIDEPYRIYANYSFNNGSVALGSCRAKSNFRIYVFQTGVFTLCSSGCSNSSYFINKTDLPVSNGDYLIIEACYLGNGRELFNVSLCGSKYVLGNSFPLCSQGYGLRRFTSSGGSSCNSKNYLWFNITSFILNQENSPLWINRLILERKINNQWQNLIYNPSSKMFESNVSIIQDVFGDNNAGSVNSYRNFVVNCSSGAYNNSKAFSMMIHDVSKPQIFIKHFSQGGSEYYSGILYNVSNGVINTSYYYSDAYVNYAVSDLECTVTYLNGQENWTVTDRYNNVIYQAVSNPSHQSTYCGGNVIPVSFNASITPVNFSLVARDNWNVTNAKSFLVNYCKEHWVGTLKNSSCNGTWSVERTYFNDTAGCGSSMYLPIVNGSVTQNFYCCTANWLNYTKVGLCNGTYTIERLLYSDNNSCVGIILPAVPADNGTMLNTYYCYETLQAGSCPSTTENVLILAMFFVIAIVFIFTGFIFRLGIIGLIGSLVLLFLSFYVAGCSYIIAVLIFFASIMLALTSIFIVPK